MSLYTELPAVLVVDDVADNRLALAATLARDDVEVVTAGSGRDALELLLRRDVAVAVVDVMMPEMDGFELAELIRGVDRTRHVPIIFVTAGSRADYRVFAGYETGAIDFLFKPVNPDVLRAKVDVLVTLERQRREVDRALERLAALQQISDAALTHLEIEPLLRELLARVRRAFRCDTATLLLLDAGRRRLEVRASDGIEREAWKSTGVPFGAGVAGAIAATGRPMVVPDVASADVASPVVKARLASMAGVPLVVNHEVRGVLLIGCVEPRAFTDADVELMQRVAARVALALDRADTYDALRLAEEKLRVALSAGRMGVWEWDVPAGRVTWSPTLEAIHGLAPGTFAGTFEAFLSDVHPEDREPLLRAIADARDQRRDLHHEYRIVRPDGEVRWVAGHGSVVVREDGQVASMMGVCMDVTERKEMERAREAAVEELEQTLRYNEVFAGVLAHDLRNPLSAILMAAQLALMRRDGAAATDPAPHRRILSSAGRMTRMIDELLDFTRARVGGGFEVHPADADLGTICGQVLGELELSHPEWAVAVASAGDLAGAWDPDRLLQVVSNLVTNSGQHGTGGRVRVGLDGSNPEHVTLEVHNAGSIPEAALPTLFDPFRRSGVHRNGGLGLGLFIAREIVLAHGGTLDVASSEATGTTFTVQLPRDAPRSKATLGITSE